MIHLKACYNKSIIKYGIIILILFTATNVFLSLINSVNNSLEDEMNKPEYRTIIITDEHIEEIEKILNSNSNLIEIKTLDKLNSQYNITFKNKDGMNEFVERYEEEFFKLSIFTFNNNSYVIARNIFWGITIICIILIYILVLIFSLNLIYNLEKDIALYKLLGFNENNIIKYLIITIYIYYLFIYLVSTVLSMALLKVISQINQLPYITIFKTLSFKESIVTWLLINISLIFAGVRIVYKIKKISPIKFIKSY